MADVKDKMSQQRLDELNDELMYLQTVKEKEISQLIKEARSFGDLSENSEYDEAKTEQGKLYSRIAEVRNLVENAEIIEKSGREDVVSLGSTITVADIPDGNEETYQIVGSQEANPMQGKISDDSPFGRGLLGASIGQTVVIEAPAGKISYKIIDVRN